MIWSMGKGQDKKRATIGANRSMKLGSKRLQGSRDLRPLKRLKFDLIQEGWGSLTKEVGQTKTTPEGGGGIKMVKDGLMTGSYDGMVQPTDVDKDGGGIITQPPPSSPLPSPTPSQNQPTQRGVEEGGRSIFNMIDNGHVPTVRLSGDENIMIAVHDNSIGGERNINITSSGGCGDNRGDSGGQCGEYQHISSERNCDMPINSMSETAPSVVYNNCEEEPEDVSVSVSVSGSIGRDNNCKIVDGVCCNGCDIKNISVTGKKWVKNKRTMLHGWKSVKVTKPICVKGSSRANLDNRAKSESERNGI